MATSRQDPPRLPVVFNPTWWEHDLARLPERGAQLAARHRRALERDGLPLDPTVVRKCDAEGRDGTNLKGCVKQYLEQWGLVFVGDTDERGRPVVVCVALGLRHPPAGSRRASVYQVADRRLARRA